MLDPSTVFDDSGPFEAALTDEVLGLVQAQLGLRLPASADFETFVAGLVDESDFDTDDSAR